jgi:RNA polymerase sigma-70 factor (ECF subfamily)
VARFPDWTVRDASPQEERSTRGLLARMREGDAQAADALFAEHRTRLARALRARIAPSRRRHVDVEDVVQEAIRKALPLVERFEWRGQGAFLAWLLQIALRTLDDHARRATRGPAVLSLSGPATESGSPSGLLPPDAAASPSEELVREEERSLLERALDQLDDADRDLVVRRAYLGQDYASLAVELGLAEGSVRMRLHRAVNAMSRWAQEHG